MKYLTKEYLITHAFERIIEESTDDFDKTLDNLENENIGLIKTYIGAIYDTNKIFDKDNPIENELLKRILTKLMLFDAVRRNAYRKVPTDYKEEYDRAMQTLKDINSGKIKLNELPPAVDESGNTLSGNIWGNISNPDFYI